MAIPLRKPPKKKKVRPQPNARPLGRDPIKFVLSDELKCEADRCAQIDNLKRPHFHMFRSAQCDVLYKPDDPSHGRCLGHYVSDRGKTLVCPCDCHKPVKVRRTPPKKKRAAAPIRVRHIPRKAPPKRGRRA